MDSFALARQDSPAALNLPSSQASRLVEAFLGGRKRTTLAAYRQDLEAFTVWTGAGTLDAAAQLLLGRGNGEANALGLAYRAHLLELGLAPATVNRRLAALRSLVTLGRVLGLVSWGLDVEGVRSQAYRDTRGPGLEGVRDLVELTRQRVDRKGLRDQALLRVLWDLALRRGEVVALDLEDLDLQAGTLAVQGKGKWEKSRLTLPKPTRQALAAWVEARGREPGPLFCNLDRAGKGSGRLTGTSLYRLVKELGRRVGLETRPHGGRHAAITHALDQTNGNVRTVQRFSRHADPRTLGRYDDSRQDLAGKVSRLVAKAF